MIKHDNPLPSVLEAFYAARDAVRVTRRIIPELKAKEPNCQNEIFHQRRKLLNRTVFISHKSAKDLLENTEEEIRDLFVLNLWVVFERFVRIYLPNITLFIDSNQNIDFCKALQLHFNKKIEYLNSEELLDFLKISFFNTEGGSTLIGSAKHILKYRDWIAHKNPKKQPPVKIVPETAYDTLNEIIEALLQQNKAVSSSVI